MTLSKSFDEDIPSENKTKRLRLYRNILIYGILCPGCLFTFAVLITIDFYFFSNIFKKVIEALGIMIVTLIIFVPLFWLVNSEYQKTELRFPNDLKYKEYLGIIKNQCKICNRHPVSKKYHIKNVHNLKQVKIKNYFVSCGCMKCQKWDYEAI